MTDALPAAPDRTLAGTAFRQCDGRFCVASKPLVLIVSGPSGAGKDSLIRSLQARGHNLHFVVTATSRPPRPGEVDGVDYHFLSPEEFERRLAAGEFLEHACVFGKRYGVLRSELTRALESGKDVILRVDVQGAATLRRLLPDAISVFVVAESVEEHLRRILARCNGEAQESLTSRCARLQEELGHLPEFQFVIVNRSEHLDEAVNQLEAVITAQKCRVHQAEQRISPAPG
jgi:guanylate kinase